jgi:arylsulfatase A-like enzyme/tetratricopeptide (TPR) repeat protein
VIIAALTIGACGRSRQPDSNGGATAGGATASGAKAGGLKAGGASAGAKTAARPSILLVTLDTTRADAVGPDAVGVQTPAFNALAARSRRFRQAYTTIPETLPAHSSIMTGLYPAGHGIHENGRHLSERYPVLAERLLQAGYRTAAFVSSFILSRRFGLARGFGVYDDELPAGQAERTSAETTNRALTYLTRAASSPPVPQFLWVHYFDPHAPYTPPEPFHSRYAKSPYLGEVAAMDQELGRLLESFERLIPGPVAVIVVADHGEGLGDHREMQHGNLLYQSTMHVPLVVMGPGIAPGVSDVPVSTRRIFNTVLNWAGIDSAAGGAAGGAAAGFAGGAAAGFAGGAAAGGAAADSLAAAEPQPEIVRGEAMKPFLSYGWQPQVMVVAERQKVISTSRLEVYDMIDDPHEAHELPATMVLRGVLKIVNDYPVPSPGAAPTPESLTDDARRSLASLGYVSATARPVIRKDAPRPVDMAGLFDSLDRASGLFIQQRYAEVIPLLEKILKEDPYNLDAVLRLATAHGGLGQEAKAAEAFKRAEAIAPDSPDVRVYRALHDARGPDWQRAAPELERIVAETPERVPALEALAVVRERQGRIAEAVTLRQKIHTIRQPSPAELIHLGELAMNVEQTSVALSAFEQARVAQGSTFTHDLELGVLYLAAHRLPEARDALDRVPSSHPAYAMALFKRAQVSVLLNEPDRATRIALARQHADATTRPLIANERLFR